MLMGTLGTVATQNRSSERYALLKRLSDISRKVFPNIELRIQEADPSFHAQAYVLDGRQVVTLRGGLAFHGCLKKDGLLFTILHEIGQRQRRTSWRPRTAQPCRDKCLAGCLARSKSRHANDPFRSEESSFTGSSYFAGQKYLSVAARCTGISPRPRHAAMRTALTNPEPLSFAEITI